VATASDDGTARVWDAGKGDQLVGFYDHDRNVQAGDAGSGQEVTQVLAHRWAVLAIAWSPDGKRVATAGTDQTARVWNAGSGGR
jgi:WD40 repeat protein